jgi:hypothetical protein
MSVFTPARRTAEPLGFAAAGICFFLHLCQHIKVLKQHILFKFHVQAKFESRLLPPLHAVHNLQYADAHQLLASSLAAKSQLCRKCGSPLNQHTCSDVHVAWLSASSSRRLSKNLPAAAAARDGGSSSSAAVQRQHNTVAAVRVCVVSTFVCTVFGVGCMQAFWHGSSA